MLSNGKANRRASALVRSCTDLFVIVRNSNLDEFGYVRFRMRSESEANENGRSLVGLKFSLLQTASTAEHVAPWVHSVSKWVMVSGVLQCWQRSS